MNIDRLKILYILSFAWFAGSQASIAQLSFKAAATECVKEPVAPAQFLANVGEQPNNASTPYAIGALNMKQFDSGYIPEVFLPGVVSVDGKNSHALSFSPDSTYFIFSRYPDRKSYVCTKSESQWSKPVEAFFLGKEVSFTKDGRKIFFYNDHDIYFVEKFGSEWSKPQSPGSGINSSEVEYYPCIVNTGTLYFSRDSRWDRGHIMRSEYKDGVYQNAVDLGDRINDGGASHAWIAPDESYMLFNSPRKGSFTKLDIWISFKSRDNMWSDPVNLGENINSGAEAILCPTVSPDGKYMYFTKLNFSTNTGYIYKVSTQVFKDIKITSKN